MSSENRPVIPFSQAPPPGLLAGGIFLRRPLFLLGAYHGRGAMGNPISHAHFSIQEVFPMADIKQDLLSLQYSTSFSLSGMEEAKH